MDKICCTLFSKLNYFAFAAPHTGNNSLPRSQARVLAATNFFTITITLLAALFITFTNALGEMSTIYTWAALIPCALINAVTLIILRKTGQLMPNQHVTLLATLFAIVACICLNGGPTASSNNILMILHSATAFALLGIRGGLAWAALVLTVQSLLFALNLSGVEFPDFQTKETMTIGAIFNWGLCCCTMIYLLFLTELNRVQIEMETRGEKERFRYLATHDDLTQLANRNLFEDSLNTAIQNCLSDHSKVLLFYIDLDDFKPINDKWGHYTGDSVLKIVAARLRASTREADTVARLGGDEFAIVLPNLDKNLPIESLAELIHERVTQPIHLHGRHIKIGCSIGIGCFPEDADSCGTLWQQADAAMYMAKRSGKRWLHFGKHNTQKQEHQPINA